jgi:2-oxoglutarate dehydrogenase E1 component
VIAYRITGSRWATLDPLKRLPRPQVPELDAAYYDLTEADLDREVMPASFVGIERTTLRSLIQALQETYCRNIGFEYMFISDRAQRCGSRSASSPAVGTEAQRGAAEATAGKADRRRAPRALPAHEVCRAEAFFRSRAARA